jgi:hypothetical protein
LDLPVAGFDATRADTDDSLTQEVYSFLSSFTAGVQRGLEAARADGGTWPGGLTGGAR